MITPIPQPPTIPFLGNAYLVEKEVPLRSFMLLAKKHGPIYQMTFPGPQVTIFVSSLELVDQVCNQQRFHKAILGPLKEVRHLTGDGLFTAFHGELNWAIAHRILMPSFGPGKIRGMFPAMTDIAQQLIDKWAISVRFGPDYVIEPTEDFTRLTFDTIALCAMSYRLNSFYSLEMAPFIKAMGSFLIEAGLRANRPALVKNYLSPTANAQFEADQKIMLDLTNEIVRKRKQSKVEIDDLLGLMLTAKDPVTGLGLSDENISANLVTFLIAGHETTSGLLSFTVNHLLNNPTAYAKVRAEVDEVLGKEPIKLEHLGKLTYITAVLREVLRLTPSVPMFGLEPSEETTLTSNGKEYKIPAGVGIRVFTAELHRDTNIWGEDADKFRPERMLNGGFERAPKNAWKPWGNGVRACIGRPLAWQEAHIVIACIFQKFDLVLHDPSYQLQLKSTLTIKPANLHIRAIPREDGPMHIHTEPIPTTTLPTTSVIRASLTNGIPFYLAYGSNSGTCKDFAQRVGTEAPAKGFNPHIVTLDSIEANIPTDGPLIIFTASYEGEPADNAGRFVEALKRSQKGEFANVRFTVFGCGHHDWVQTYQKIPTLVDQLLGESGAQRLMDRVAADSGADDFFETFDNWVPKLWERLGEAYGERVHAEGETRETLSVQVNADVRPLVLGKEETSGLGKVISNRVLTSPGAPAKHHIEIALPENVTYQSGDYLCVLPRNPAGSVQRVLSRFGLLPDQEIIIKSTAATTLPTNKPISVSEILAGYVEISQTATRKNIHELQKFSSETVSAKLQNLLADYKNEVFDKHISVLDILELYPDISIPLASFLHLLPAMRIRQYSISSSPLWNPTHVTLTLSVVQEAASSGLPTRFLGVASNYLANVNPGDPIHIGVRSSGSTFHLPQDPTVPVVMFAAGSGMAPMRGFIQERAIQAASGQKVGRTVLFYGCRYPDQDFLYSEDDLKEWEKLDFVEIKPAFSRVHDKSFGAKYVQERVWHDRDLIGECYEAGAKFYTCGSPPVANGIKEVILKLIKLRQPTWDDERIARSWDIIQKDRLATDVFA